MQCKTFEPTAKHIHHSGPAQGRKLPAAQWLSSAKHDAGGSASEITGRHNLPRESVAHTGTEHNT